MLAWLAVAALVAATDLRAEPFDGMPRSEPFMTAEEMPSILATPVPEAGDGLGWSAGGAGGPPGSDLEPAPAEGFLVTDGCIDGSCCAACGGGGCDACCGGTGMFDKPGLCNRILGPACPRWVVQIDALMLWQGNIASRPLFSAVDPTTAAVGPTLLDANQAQTVMAAGPRVGLFFNLDDTYAIEGNYFQVRPFNGQAVAPPGNILVERNLAGFSDDGFDGAQVLSNAAIQSAELNWRRRECWCPVTWLAGFRWVEWNQQMRIVEHLDGAPFSSFTSQTGNDLYGGQAGMELGLWNGGGPVTVTGIGKAGVFYNNAFQRTAYRDPGFAPSAGAVADQTAFFGELGVNGSLRLTNWLSWRLGYVLFWLNGVAVPAAQFSTTNLNDAVGPVSATINTNGSVLLHGVTTGLEARW